MPIRPSNPLRHWTELLLRVALGGYFAWSGAEKVFKSGLSEFTRSVANYRFVHPPWDAVVAYTIPWVEIVAGVCLVLGLCRRGALATLAGLVGVFAIGVGHAWRQGLDISCGCHGNPDGPPMDYTMKFVEFGGYLLVIAVIWALAPRGGGHLFGGEKMKLPG